MRHPRKLSERDQRRVGLVGLMVTALLVAGALSVSSVSAALTTTDFTADLAETGGLQEGDDVRVSGLKVGEVTDVGLAGDHVAVDFTADVVLGDRSTAVVKSDNALGRKYLAIVPAGRGEADHIPVERTDPGYAVTTALGDLATSTGDLDVAQMSKAFDSLSNVLGQTPEEFRSALEGVSALSTAISTRDEELGALLKRTSSLSKVLADRSVEITSIFANGSLLLQELALRRQIVRQMLIDVRAMSVQLQGLVRENAGTLPTALREIKTLAGTLKDYRYTLDYALTNLGPYISGLGEAVGSGPFFQAYVQNITAPTTLVPVLSDIMDGKRP